LSATASGPFQAHGAECQRIQKTLEDAGIKLDSVAADVLGVSGRAMLAALVAGERDPQVLAELAKGKLRKKLPQLRQALRGRFGEHHALLVGLALDHLAKRVAAGVMAQAMRMPAVPSSPSQCPRPASAVQCPVRRPVSTRACPRGCCPLSGAGVWAVQVSGVRCPTWVSGVRAFPRPLCPTRRSWRAAVGGQPHSWMAGVGVVVSRINGRLVVCPDRNLAVKAGAGHAGQRRRRLVLGRRRGRWLGSGQVACIVTRRGRMWTRITPLVGEPGCAARWQLRSVVTV
jgi:hypothetical protein